MRVQMNVVLGRGLPERVVLDATSVASASEQYRGKGYAVLSARPVGLNLLERYAGRRAPSRLDVPVFVEQLRDLLGAGLSVVEALATLQAAGRERDDGVIDAVLARLRGGSPLSSALAAEPQFPALLVSLVRAAEWTSDLPRALSRFLEHEQRVREVRDRIASVAIYPLLLVGVGLAVMLFLLLYVVPRFARVFEGMNGTLPWSARAMVEWSHWLGGRGPWLLALLAGVMVALAAAIASPAMRARLLEHVLDATWLRKRLRTYFLARWFRATGMLVEGGIPLAEALALSNGLLPRGLQAGGVAVERAIRDGYGPTEAHVRAGMITPVAEQLMLAGERTGDLGGVLTRIAQFHEAEVARVLERTMRALEPIVMIFIGVGVGAVVVLMYMPIFELASAIQ